jgi:hypothetical protein
VVAQYRYETPAVDGHGGCVSQRCCACQRCSVRRLGVCTGQSSRSVRTCRASVPALRHPRSATPACGAARAMRSFLGADGRADPAVAPGVPSAHDPVRPSDIRSRATRRPACARSHDRRVASGTPAAHAPHTAIRSPGSRVSPPRCGHVYDRRRSRTRVASAGLHGSCTTLACRARAYDQVCRITCRVWVTRCSVIGVKLQMTHVVYAKCHHKAIPREDPTEISSDPGGLDSAGSRAGLRGRS